MHILILTDRDWTHPQAGGTGTHLDALVSMWLQWGHRVTILTGAHANAPSLERSGNLTIYRKGSRSTVFPLAILRRLSGKLPQADVTLEVINGVCWLTPLWGLGPRVSLVHHVHRRMYVDEMGPKGRIAAFLLETLPLLTIYRRSSFLTVSEATKGDLAEMHALPSSAITVVYSGIDSASFAPLEKGPKPTMLYLGRLKAYKRIELLFDVLAALPDLSLDILGDGDHGPELVEIVRLRGLDNRVRFHGFVDDEVRRKMLAEAWVAVTASNTEGWSLSTIEAAASGTPTVDYPVGGLKESIVNGETGIHVDSLDQFIAAVDLIVSDEELRTRLSVQARARAMALSWDKAARETLAELEAEIHRTDSRPQARQRVTIPRPAPVAKEEAVAGGDREPRKNR